MPRTTSAIALLSAFALLVAASGAPGSLSAEEAEAGAKAPVQADRVAAIYFHRTQRCPTCLKMGSYAEEAVRTKFSKQLQQGAVAFHYVDFQHPKNAALTKGYRITGPALVVARIQDNRVAEFMNLEDIWMKVQDKPAFLQYVQDNIKAYSDKLAQAATR